MNIDDVSGGNDRAAWELALEVVETGRVERSSVRRVLAAYRERQNLTRLKQGAALADLVLHRAEAIRAKRRDRQAARLSDAQLVPVSQRWPTLARNEAFRERLWAYHVWRAVEALAAAD